jgi:phage terminase large subunit-like protein
MEPTQTDSGPAKKRGRPRKWGTEAERRAAQAEKRRARHADAPPPPDHAALREAAISVRVASLSAPTRELQVRDVDLLELAAEFPNTAEGFQYARDVISGAIDACQSVRQACERHERDLARIPADDWPYTFNAQYSERVLRSCQMFREIRGPRAGKRFRFAAWQKFVIGSAWGWVEKTTTYRRFRYVFMAVPRGNGKSSLAATLGLYMLALDGEGGAEVYAAAVTRDQARIVFNLAQHMARNDATFRGKYGINVASHVITQEATASVFRPLSRDAQALDGLNVLLAILDELAAHKTREVHDVLVTATGKRTQPMILSITTAGVNQSGVGYEQWKYALRVLNNETQDERFFGIVYTIDDLDDWQDPASWAKANPNWGLSVNPDTVANLAHRASQIASQQAAFKQKHLNVWTNAAVAWMNMLQWHACADPTMTEEDFRGEDCVLGLDLAAKIDLAAAIKLFARLIDGVTHYYCFARFYLPEAAILDGRNASYATWEADGWITGTPGEVIDFDVIEQDIINDASLHRILDVAYDPWQALKLAADLGAIDIPVIEYRPTVANFSPAMKEIDALVRQGRFHHNGNAVLSWNVTCVEIVEDFKGNIFPRKDRDDPQKKIDGLVALLMAMGRRMALESTPGTEPTLTFV